MTIAQNKIGTALLHNKFEQFLKWAVFLLPVKPIECEEIMRAHERTCNYARVRGYTAKLRLDGAVHWTMAVDQIV